MSRDFAKSDHAAWPGLEAGLQCLEPQILARPDGIHVSRLLAAQFCHETWRRVTRLCSPGVAEPIADYMAFWNRTRTPEPPKTYTNAPSHWPVVQCTQFDNSAIAMLEVLGTLPKDLEPRGAVFSVLRTFVYDDGILEAPIVVEEGGTKTAVFVYGNHDTKAAPHYAAMRTLLRTREQINAVYYGPSPLGPVAAGVALKPLDTPMFSKLAAPPAEASYALWWATPDQPRFSDSEDRVLLDRWFEALDGYGYALFSLFARALDLVESKDAAPTLVRLPEQPFLLAVAGPGAIPFMLHAAATDGLFLGFDRSKVEAAQRRTWLRLLVDFAERCRAIVAVKLPVDPQDGGLATWREIRDDAIRQEAAGETDLVLHEIAVRQGLPIRSPHARSGRTRAAAETLPSREVIEFGLDVIQRAVAQLRDRAVTPSDPEKPGPPNFGPTLIVRAAGRRTERDFAHDDFQLVLDAAARVRADWPDADCVAILADSALRENGQRVDVVRVLVQGSDGAADIVQRYTLGSDARFATVGRPAVMPHASFVPSPPGERPAGPSAPDADLVAMVEHALPIAARLADPAPDGQAAPALPPQRMPRALVDRGEAQGTAVMFAMMGGLTAQAACRRMLEEDPAARSVVFWYDDHVRVDGQLQPRVRFMAQRRGDPAAAIIELPVQRSSEGAEVVDGPRTFVGWADSLFPIESKAA